MTNLHKKLNSASAHIRLSAEEKSTMRARLFGAPSPMRPARSPYLFVSQKWMAAFAALLVVFVGGTTAYASQGALPGQPLYAVKTAVVEPMMLVLAQGPAAKAAVHVELAQRRVAEAETLASQGTLTASTSAALAANFEQHADSASALADQVSAQDPAAAVQIKTQLSASSAVGGAVLAALGGQGQNSSQDKQSADSLAVRVLARADTGRGNDARAFAPAGATAPTPAASVRPMAVSTFSASATITATGTQEGEGSGQASPSPEAHKVALSLQARAEAALADARALAATSTLSASTTAKIEASLGQIEALIQSGAAAQEISPDAAQSDFTDALSQALKLQALLSAEHSFGIHIDALFSGERDAGSAHSGGDSGSNEPNADGGVVHALLDL